MLRKILQLLLLVSALCAQSFATELSAVSRELSVLLSPALRSSIESSVLTSFELRSATRFLKTQSDWEQFVSLLLEPKNVRTKTKIEALLSDAKLPKRTQALRAFEEKGQLTSSDLSLSTADSGALELLSELNFPAEKIVSYHLKLRDMPSIAPESIPIYDRYAYLNRSADEQVVSSGEIRFMQNDCSNTTADKNFTVLQNAYFFRIGKLAPENLPVIRVWRDVKGVTWTLDHRRLAGVRLAGNVPFIKVHWASEAEVAQSLFKFSTVVDGKAILLKIDRVLAARVE